MRKTIERTITVTRVFYSSITVENGTITTTALPSIEVNGKLNNDKALKLIQAKHGKDGQFVITAIEEKEERYEISVEDFIKHATIIKTGD